MPSKKGRHMASRQGLLAQRGKRKGTLRHQLSNAQLQGPGAPGSAGVAPGALTSVTQDDGDDSAAETIETLAARELNVEGAKAQTAVPAAATVSPSATQSISPRARRERQAIAAQSGPKLQSEVLRIGIVMFIIAGILVGLTFGTDLGA